MFVHGYLKFFINILHALCYEVMPNLLLYMYLTLKDKLCVVLVKSACNRVLGAWEDLPIFPGILLVCKEPNGFFHKLTRFHFFNINVQKQLVHDV